MIGKYVIDCKEVANCSDLAYEVSKVKHIIEVSRSNAPALTSFPDTVPHKSYAFERIAKVFQGLANR